MTLIALPHADLSTRRIGLHTFAALLARDLRVLRGQLGSLLVRAVMQPLFFTFVFTYVMPKIGLSGAPGVDGRGFSTILVPGLVAITIAIQGIMAVTMPLLLEFSYNKEIEDRAMAPLPIWMLGVQKIASGAIQALLAGLLVFPIVLLVHAKGQAPYVHVYHWPLFVAVMLLSCLLGAATGLLLGTLVDIKRAQQFFAVVVTPLTMLGCVYYSWSTLDRLPWLQVAVLLNPVVYMSEGLRATLTPQLPHLPVWAFLLALGGGTVAVGALAVRAFVRRVVG
ncbi:ABC transporter permease [Micromonospora sp. NPDC050980]|uniref:ABC transporter permease n=1 Tax=Micromonospora sp. NPDC050980 TaxID=3155161 RepID=UPI00340CF172